MKSLSGDEIKKTFLNQTLQQILYFLDKRIFSRKSTNNCWCGSNFYQNISLLNHVIIKISYGEFQFICKVFGKMSKL